MKYKDQLTLTKEAMWTLFHLCNGIVTVEQWQKAYETMLKENGLETDRPLFGMAGCIHSEIMLRLINTTEIQEEE